MLVSGKNTEKTRKRQSEDAAREERPGVGPEAIGMRHTMPWLKPFISKHRRPV